MSTTEEWTFNARFWSGKWRCDVEVSIWKPGLKEGRAYSYKLITTSKDSGLKGGAYSGGEAYKFPTLEAACKAGRAAAIQWLKDKESEGMPNYKEKWNPLSQF